MSTLIYIARFLPILLLVYFFAWGRLRHLVLIAGSLIYMGCFGLPGLGLLVGSGVGNYLLGCLIGSRRTVRSRRVCTALGVLCNIVFWMACRLTSIEAVGVSFYTFTAIAYLIDLYTGKAKSPMNVLQWSTTFTLFPKLLQGPIVRTEDMKRQLRRLAPTAESVEQGLRLFVLGLIYKTLLADRLGILWNNLHTIGIESISTPLAWLGAYGYSLQLFFDWQGYSLMAIGVGRMLGIELPENFNSPYLARSVSEFYRRWHITLGLWFRDYVYIPLGGSRKGTVRALFNLLLVWLLTGLWHGLTVNFLLWGVTLGVLICLEKLFLGKLLNKVPLLGHLYVLAVLPLTWMLFANGGLTEVGIYFARLFPVLSGYAGISVNTSDFLKQLTMFWPYLLAGVLLCLIQPEKWIGLKRLRPATSVVLVGMFWVCVYAQYSSASNPFLYLKF